MKGTNSALHSSWLSVSHNGKCNYVASSFKEGKVLISGTRILPAKYFFYLLVFN